MERKGAAEIFKSIKKRLLKFIQSRVNLPEDAEDIMQEVFYQIEGGIQ